MRKRIIQSGTAAAVLALVFTVSAFSGKAAQAVDTGKDCSVEFSVGGEIQELRGLSIPVRLYKVASISETGSYTAEKGFESLDFGFVKDDESAASIWMERAAQAAKLCEGRTAEKEGVIEGGSAYLDGIQTGLYLVVAEDVQSAQYGYRFSPYLISLPNNYFYTSGTGDDTWVYDGVEVGLKPEQTERLGDLQIDKELISQNTTMGEKATFVFQIDITTPKGETERKNVALTFDDVEQKSAVIKGIPAGSTVTVTEVYEGAGYQLVEGIEAAQTTVIVADDTVSVSYVNEHDGTVTGGYGVVNQYKVDDSGLYQWNKLEDNSGSQS